MKLGSVFSGIMVTLGLALLSYPLIASNINAVYQADKVREYISSQEKVNVSELKMSAENYNSRLPEIMANAKDYNNSLDSKDVEIGTKPGDEYLGDPEYLAQLALPGTDVMSRIVVPGINIDLPVYHGTSGAVLKKGAGHIHGTSLPIGGIDTHSAISAHTGLPEAPMFDKLTDVKIGDIFIVETLGEKMGYKVIETEVVDPVKGVANIKIRPGKDLVSLVTCTPYAVNTHRLVVTGERTELPAEYENADDVNVKFNLWPMVLYPVAAISGFILIGLIRHLKKMRNINEKMD